MDDFGTGYSSLNLLKNIDLDVLKLDMEFFRNTEGTSRERAVVESVVRMAHALDLTLWPRASSCPSRWTFCGYRLRRRAGLCFLPPRSSGRLEEQEAVRRAVNEHFNQRWDARLRRAKPADPHFAVEDLQSG